MTEILFSMPVGKKKTYVVKNIDMTITSLEEFAYFYAKNIIFLDDSVMQEDFEDWIHSEMEAPEMARRLRHIREEKSGCIEYFSLILNTVLVFTEEEKREILKQAREFVHKNQNQKRKLLGDRLFLREKYQSAIKEYYSLIREESFSSESNDFIGSVWHNLGCCYGMCFMFDKALECFKEAYSYSFSPETQNAVTFVVKTQQKEAENAEVQQDTFLNYLNYTGQSGRVNRYDLIAQRMADYRKGVEE